MMHATSQDGTKIAYDATGTGPALILVASALSDRADARKLAGHLQTHFTVINYDRRGRGASEDTAPYAVDREVEDLQALIEANGGSAHVFGSSSGAVLALRAAAQHVGVEKLAVFEPPFRVHPQDDPQPLDLVAQLDAWIAHGQRGEAVKYFMKHEVGVPAPLLALMRLAPKMWAKLVALAHTLPYDYAVMGNTLAGAPLTDSPWSLVTVPTLVIDAGKSPPRLRNAAAALAEVLPRAERTTLARQSHSAVVMSPKRLAHVLTTFYQTPSPIDGV